MAKKKLTPQQRELTRLATGFQTSVSQLTPEYEKVFSEKQKQIEKYNEDIKSYQTKLNAYNRALKSEGTKVGPTFVAGKQGNAIRIDGNLYYINPWGDNLPENYYAKERYETRMEYPRHSPAREYQALVGYDVYYKPLPTLDAAEPEQPDLSSYDTKMAELEEKRKGLSQTFEREKTERRSARLRAVTQGSRERPMLSKGVTLNG